jgi:hypothetical protein
MKSAVPGVGVVVGDVAVKERRGLARRQQPVVLQHVERQRPGLVGVHHHARAADAMDRRVDALRGELDHALAFERLAGLVEHDHVARARLGPVQAEGQDQVAIVAAGHGDREVVVDAFLELVQHGEAVRGGQVDPGLAHRVGGGRNQRVNGHGGMIPPGEMPGSIIGRQSGAASRA